MKHYGIIARLLAAIALGVAVGLVLPAWGIRALNTVGSLIGQFIKFVVPFIVIGLVTPSIIDLGRSAGRKLLTVVGVAYVSTLCAGAYAYAVSTTLCPRFLTGVLGEAAKGQTFAPYFKLTIPPVVGVTTALAVSFMFGLAAAHVKSDALRAAFGELKEVVTLTIRKAVMPLLPLFILTIVADIAASGRLVALGANCFRLMGFAFAVTVSILLVQYLIAGAVARKNPLRALWNMLPAYLTGWGCCSSSATIPVTLACVKRNGVDDATAGLVVPLCSSIHLAGSMSNMIVYSVGLVILAGESVSLGAFVEYILTISVIAVAAPGVPGGVVLTCAAVAESILGFSPERYAVLMAMYLSLDGMGTSCNLTGDGAIALALSDDGS